VVDVAVAAGHAAVVEKDRRPVGGRFLEVRTDALLSSVALLEGALVLRLAVQGDQEAADPRVPGSNPCLPADLAAFMFAGEAGAWSPAVECLIQWWG